MQAQQNFFISFVMYNFSAGYRINWFNTYQYYTCLIQYIQPEPRISRIKVYQTMVSYVWGRLVFNDTIGVVLSSVGHYPAYH